MAHTNSTQNYGLPQWIGTDKPTFLGDLNSAFSEIDARMKINSDDATTLDAEVQTIKTNVTTAQENIEALQSGATTQESVNTQLRNLIDSNAGSIDTLNTNVATINTELESKQSNITGGASSITDSNLTTNRALISDSSGKVTNSSVSSTELERLSGVTGNIQTQLNNKAKGTWITLLDKHVDSTERTYTINDLSQYKEIMFTVYKAGVLAMTEVVPVDLFLYAYIINMNIGDGLYTARLINNTSMSLKCTVDYAYEMRISVR